MRPSLCDTSVWLALALSGHPHHGSARTWLDGVEEAASVLFCRATQQSFLRLLTSEAILAAYGDPPLTNAEAWDVYEKLVADDRIVLRAEEPDRLDAYWERFAARQVASPKLWMDAYLAAFATAADARLVTIDAGFRQATSIRVVYENHRAIL